MGAGVAVGVGKDVGVDAGVAVGVGKDVGVGAGVAVGVGKDVGAGVAVGVGRDVGVSAGVAVGVGWNVAVCSGVTVGTTVETGWDVDVGNSDPIGVAVEVGVSVGVAVASRAGLGAALVSVLASDRDSSSTLQPSNRSTATKQTNPVKENCNLAFRMAAGNRCVDTPSQFITGYGAFFSQLNCTSDPTEPQPSLLSGTARRPIPLRG